MGKSRKTVRRKVAVEHLDARLAAAGQIVSLLLALLAWYGIGLTTGGMRFFLIFLLLLFGGLSTWLAVLQVLDARSFAERQTEAICNAISQRGSLVDGTDEAEEEEEGE